MIWWLLFWLHGSEGTAPTPATLLQWRRDGSAVSSRPTFVRRLE